MIAGDVAAGVPAEEDRVVGDVGRPAAPAGTSRWKLRTSGGLAKVSALRGTVIGPGADMC